MYWYYLKVFLLSSTYVTKYNYAFILFENGKLKIMVHYVTILAGNVIGQRLK